MIFKLKFAPTIHQSTGIPRILVLLAMLFAFSSLHAQQKTEDFERKKGDIEFNAGIGLVSTFINVNTKNKIPPLSVTIGYRLKKHLSLGAYIGYSASEYTEIGEDGERNYVRNNFHIAGLRFEGHFQRDRTNFYGGAMLGYTFSNISTNITDPKGVQNILIEDGQDAITYSGFIGMKHLVTERIGIFGEVGYGVSLVNLGVSYKL